VEEDVADFESETERVGEAEVVPVFVTEGDRVRVAVFGPLRDIRGEPEIVVEAVEVFDTRADFEPVADTKAVRDSCGLRVADLEICDVTVPNDPVALGELDAVADTVVVNEFVLAVALGVGVKREDNERDIETVSEMAAVPVIDLDPRGVFVIETVAVEHRDTGPDTDSVGDPVLVRLWGPVRLPVGVDVGDAVSRKLVVGAAVAVVVFDVVTDAVVVFVTIEVAESVGLADSDFDGLIVAVAVPLTELVFVGGAVAV